MEKRKILTGNQIEIRIKKIIIGGRNKPVLIGGPCAIESKEQIMSIAKSLKISGCDILRGGAFKPRTSPYKFQGLGEEGLKYLKEAGECYDLPVITELIDSNMIDKIIKYTDVVQIGSRNMYNYSLLKAVGKIDKPVLLKRGMSATVNEWALAAEYIASHGNNQIILCERGIRSFDSYTRNVLDLSAIPIMQNETGLPVVVDPSHGTGIKGLIKPMSKAALAAGANGLMIEVHNEPDKALCDGYQSLMISEYNDITCEIKTK